MNVRFALPLALAALIAGAPSAPSQRFVLAIVRLDGAIVPFAAYDGGRWESAWPAADEETQRPATIDRTQSVWRKRGERVPRVWTVWPSAGGRSIQARVTGIEVADAHCGKQVALKTDMRPIKAKHPAKFGVAVDSNLPVVSIEAIRE